MSDIYDSAYWEEYRRMKQELTRKKARADAQRDFEREERLRKKRAGP